MKQLLSLFVLCSIMSMAFSQNDEMSLHVSLVSPDGANTIEISTERSDVSNSLEAELKTVEDLCENANCGPGEVCVMNNDVARCECVEMCESPKDTRQQICTSSNRTFDSDCHFLRQKCWCRNEDIKCTDSSILKDKLDYYGACQYMEQCSEEQKKVFPDRMKIWLDEILHILNERDNLDPKYFNLVKLADEMKANHTQKYWTAGVAFEFCKLDLNNDHNIQKEELRSLVASIKALESCIQPFLDECDRDHNDVIGDDEWAHCLDLSDGDLETLREYC